MSEKKPEPLIPVRVRNRCPVCGEVSYSRAGIHPQCSVRQEDEQRKDRLKREKLLAEEQATPPPESGIAPWQKSCPQCDAVQHVRKKVCICGHKFAAKARPPNSEGEET